MSVRRKTEEPENANGESRFEKVLRIGHEAKPARVVDETGVIFREGECVFKYYDSRDAMIIREPQLSDRDDKPKVTAHGKEYTLKKNSGDFQLWKTLSQGKIHYLHSVVDLGIEPKFENRDYFLKELTKSEMYSKTSPTMHMMRPEGGMSLSDPLIFTNRNQVNPLDGKRVIGLKLWGFAGIRSATDCIPAYKEAVEKLMPAILNFVKAYKPENVAIAIRFDGDPMFEKSAPKFTHALFGPLVAEELRKHFKASDVSTPHIALVMTKVDGDPKEKFISKFFDTIDGNHVLRSKETPGYHSYPGADLFESGKTGHFDSIMVAYALGNWKEQPASEVKNQQIFLKLLDKKPVADFCICIGGNTQGGATSWLENLPAFTNVVRQTIFAEE